MTGCWEWTLYRNENGYGKLCRKGHMYLAHRYFYETCFGPVPKGMELDHLCRNRWCCNPDHLETVTHAENIRRGLTGKHNAVKTRCRKGHEFTEENTYRWKPTYRFCRACNREAALKLYHRNKATKK